MYVAVENPKVVLKHWGFWNVQNLSQQQISASKTALKLTKDSVLAEVVTVPSGKTVFIHGNGQTVTLKNNTRFLVESLGKLCLFDLNIKGGSDVR